MKHLFLDTNIVLDVLANRLPFATQSAKLFDCAVRGKVKLYISALSYSNLFYLLRKNSSTKTALSSLKELEKIMETLELNKQIIHSALYANFNDFEDAVQHYCALNNKKISAIITRNSKDYKKSELPILSPEEALAMITGHETN